MTPPPARHSIAAPPREADAPPIVIRVDADPVYAAPTLHGGRTPRRPKPRGGRMWVAVMLVVLGGFAAIGLAEQRGLTRESGRVDPGLGPLDVPARPAPRPAGAAVPVPPAPFPAAGGVSAARRYAASRAGTVSFAAIDTRGRLRGHDGARAYASASLVKAMLLVAHLRGLAERGEPLTPEARARLSAMIRMSDNDAANATSALVGPAGLSALARRAGMRRFVPSTIWGGSRVAAADQARFFLRIDRLTPARHRAFVRGLLASVVPWQRWGIPRVLPRGWRAFFKGGWLPTSSGNLVHQAALLEHRDGRRVALAILTDGNPSHAYGTRTVRGVAARLLRDEP